MACSCPGLALGLEVRFPGIAVQTVGITLAVFLSMLVLYATGAIKVTRKFLTVVYTSTAAIAIVYLTGFDVVISQKRYGTKLYTIQAID